MAIKNLPLQCGAILLLILDLFLIHAYAEHEFHKSKVLTSFEGDSVRGISLYGSFVAFALSDKIVVETSSEANGVFVVAENDIIKISGVFVEDVPLMEFKLINESAAFLCTSTNCGVCYRTVDTDACHVFDFTHSSPPVVPPSTFYAIATSLVNENIIVYAAHDENTAILYVFEPVGLFKYKCFKSSTEPKFMKHFNVVAGFSTPSHTYFVTGANRRDLAVSVSMDVNEKRLNTEVRIARICNKDQTNTLDSRIDLVLSCEGIDYSLEKEINNEVTTASYFPETERILVALRYKKDRILICEYKFKDIQERFDQTWNSCQSRVTQSEKIEQCQNKKYHELPPECFIFTWGRNSKLPICEAFNKLTGENALDNCALHTSNSTAYRYGQLENLLPLDGKVIYNGTKKTFMALKESNDPRSVFALEKLNKVQRLELNSANIDNILTWRPAKYGPRMLELVKNNDQILFVNPQDEYTVNNLHISCGDLYPMCQNISWVDSLNCGFCANADGTGVVMSESKFLCPTGHFLKNVCPPVIKYFNYAVGEYLIEGSDFDKLLNPYVTICDQKCNITSMQDRYIRCKVPKQREKYCNVTVIGYLSEQYDRFQLQKGVDGDVGSADGDDSSNKSHSTMKILRYLGFALAFIVLILLVCFSYYQIHKYIKRRRGKAPGKLPPETSIAPAYTSVLPDVPLEDFGLGIPTIRNSQLEFIKVIGEGCSATVHLAKFQEDLSKEVFMDVAVKTSKEHWNDADAKKEIEMIKIVNHKNVVKFLGWAMNNNNKIMIVTEYMGGGSVEKYLRDPNKRPTIGRCFSFIEQILDGMVYLCHNHIVHRDLATRNCLLNNTYEILKISDFGLSRKTNLDYEYVSNNDPRLPFRWLPLETLLNCKTFTFKGDVWSFGIVIWELFQRATVPYEGLDMRGLIDFLDRDQRLGKPQYCPDELYEVMLYCWDREPENRPTFDTLKVRISQILADVERQNPSQIDQEYERPTPSLRTPNSNSLETRTSGSNAVTAV